METDRLFQDDAYRKECEAIVLASGKEGIVLDRTVFYPMGGGQPGDTGAIEFVGGACAIRDTRHGEGGRILHLPEEDSDLPPVGATVRARIDWRELPLPGRYPRDRAAAERVLAGKPRHWLDWYRGRFRNPEGGPVTFVPGALTAEPSPSNSFRNWRTLLRPALKTRHSRMPAASSSISSRRDSGTHDAYSR